LSIHINQYAIFNTNRKRTPNKLATALLPKKEKIDTINWQIAAYLYNYTLNQKATGDSSTFAYINPILEEERNAPFSEYLLLAKACYYYYNQEVSKALDLLISVRGLSPELFNYVLGVWLIEAGDTEKAIEFLKRATFLGDTAAYYALAIALLENGQWNEALENWNTILNDPEATLLMKQKAVEIQRISEATEETITRLSDLEKYGFIYYGRHNSVESAKKIINDIKEVPYQIAAITSLMHQVLNTDEWEEADVLYNTLPKEEKIPLWIQSQLSVAYLELLLRKRDYNTILSNIAQAPLVGFQENYRNFYRGAALVGLGKIQQAQEPLSIAVKSLPFEEAVYIQQANLYNQQKAYQKAYNTLVTGVGFLPGAADLWKAYAYQCLQVRLLSYAEDAQNKLKTLLNAAEYRKFEQDFLEEKQKVEEAIYSFGINK
ncbi:MAG: tetratricopeptide repeat protein, partial [Bacteroidota bacterium]